MRKKIISKLRKRRNLNQVVDVAEGEDILEGAVRTEAARAAKEKLRNSSNYKSSLIIKINSSMNNNTHSKIAMVLTRVASAIARSS